MDQVKCHFDIPEIEGLKPSEMTVGRHGLMTCEGAWNKSFDMTKAQIKLEENQKYMVKVLKAEARDANTFDLDLTLYVAGQARFSEMILTDGSNEINLGQQQFEVQTVIEKQQDGKAPEPYGYLSPLRLEWPVLYSILFVSAIILFLVVLIWRLRKAARYAQLMSDLQNYNSPLSADLQFYKTFRQLEKSQFPLAETEKAFRLYVLRVFQVPMFKLANKQILRFFKKRKVAYKNERLQIEKILSEFEEIQTSKKNISDIEKQELITKIYRFVDKSEQKMRPLP